MSCPPQHKTETQKSLRYSVLDGSAYSAMIGLTQDYVVPFAIVIKATTAQIGILVSLPYIAMSLCQLVSPCLAERAGSRKGLILPVVLLHALLWIPILFLPYLFPDQKIWWLIGFFTISTIFGSMGNPAWGSLMADLVPENQRGRYFAYRNKISNLATLIFFFIGGAILQYFTHNVLVGFSIIFCIAIIFRFVSWFYLSKMHEPPASHTQQKSERIIDIARNIRASNVGRFIIFVSLMNFSVYLASPFFAVYMLRDLGFNYLTYVYITATATLASVLFMSYWGKRADMAGNIKIIRITSILIPFVPLLWIFSRELYFLIPAQILSGFAWAGFNLASTNFIYDASNHANRTRFIAVFNAINGSAICIGGLLGGLIATRLPPVFGYSVLTLFLISGILRMLVAATLLRHIAEVRNVPECDTAELLIGKIRFARDKLRSRWQHVYIMSGNLLDEMVPIALPTSSSGYVATSATRSPPA